MAQFSVLRKKTLQKMTWQLVSSAFYPQCHVVSVAWTTFSGPRGIHRGLHRLFSYPRERAAPWPCAGGTTACPGSTPSRTASRDPGNKKGLKKLI